jgi:hypothetical protein
MQIAGLSSPGVSPHHQVVMKKLKLSSSLKEHEDIHTQHGAFLFPHIFCSQGKSQSIASKNRTIRKRKLNTPRAKCQQRSRRRDSQFWKAFEYCCECDADIFLMIRLKHNGQNIYVQLGWPLASDARRYGRYLLWKQGNAVPNNSSVLPVSNTEDYNLARTCRKIYKWNK